MEGLLQYIDQIDQSVVDAEVGVMESLIESYDKSIMILENATDDTDLSAFDIFQEGERWDQFKKDTEAPVFGNKGESLIKRILMIIPRLIQKLVVLIRKIFAKNKNVDQQIENNIEQLKAQAQQSPAASMQNNPSMPNAPEIGSSQVSPAKPKTASPQMDTIDTGKPTQSKNRLYDCEITINGVLMFITDDDNALATTIAISYRENGMPKIAPNDLSFKSLQHVNTYITQLNKYIGRVETKIAYFNNASAKPKTLKIKYGTAVDKLAEFYELYKHNRIKFIDSQLTHINEVCQKINAQLNSLKQERSNGPSNTESAVLNAFGAAFGIPADAMVSEGPEFVSAIEQYLSKLSVYSSKLNVYINTLNQTWVKHIAALREAVQAFGNHEATQYSKNGLDINIEKG